MTEAPGGDPGGHQEGPGFKDWHMNVLGEYPCLHLLAGNTSAEGPAGRPSRRCSTRASRFPSQKASRPAVPVGGAIGFLWGADLRVAGIELRQGQGRRQEQYHVRGVGTGVGGEGLTLTGHFPDFLPGVGPVTFSDSPFHEVTHPSVSFLFSSSHPCVVPGMCGM